MPYRISRPAHGQTVGRCIRLGWAVILTCDSGHSARWNVARLAEDFAPEVTLDQIAERLTCKVCGSRDGSLDIRHDRAVTLARDIAAKEADGR